MVAHSLLLSSIISRLPAFTGLFKDRLERLPFEAEPVLGYLHMLYDELRPDPISIVDDDEALRRLARYDIWLMIEALQRPSVREGIEAYVPTPESLRACAEQAATLLGELDLGFQFPPIRIEDVLPGKYAESTFAALSIDPEGWDGIDFGVYFLKRLVRPVYSHFLLFHELLHTLVGSYDLSLGVPDDEHTRLCPLEEGFCELIGSLYLSAKILGRERTRQLFIYNRFSSLLDPTWEVYLDATRQAARLYRRYGLRGVAAVLQGGRSGVQRAQQACIEGRLSELDLPSGVWDDDLDALVEEPLFSYARSLTVSPMAKYLLPFVRDGMAIEDLFVAARVEPEAGLRGLSQLQGRLLLSIVENGARIRCPDTRPFLQDGVVRYIIPDEAAILL